MFLTRRSVTSNASRAIVQYKSKWYDRTAAPKALYRVKRKGGRSTLTGRTIIWTKKKLLTRFKTPRIDYNLRFTQLGFISTFHLTRFTSKLTAVLTFVSGIQVCVPATDSMRLLTLACSRAPGISYRKAPITYVSQLIFMLKKFTKISNLELIPGKGVQYARSAGCFAKITKVNSNHQTALIQLPSGVHKFFSIHGVGVAGASALRLKRKTQNTKSGFWRTFGLKPRVRGVARNPVDHPHGGRTKSIKYPRTPWGKTTKFK